MADFFMIFTDFYKLKGLNKFNSLNVHAFFKKVCVLLLFLCGAVSFAENYYWQGGASGEWAAAGNWYTVITNADSSTSTQTAASAPGTGDTAIFSVQVSQNTDVSAFTITDSSVTSGAITSEAGITFFGSLTASGDITIDSGDLTVGENLTVTGSTTVTDGNLTVEGSYTGNKTSDAAADISVSGDFVVENTGETNIRGVVTANSINIKKNRTSLLGGTTSVTTTGTQNYGGEVLVNEGITISASTVTFGGKFVSHTTGSCKSVTIEGNAEFNDEAGVSLGSSNGDKLDSLSVSGTSTVSNNIYTKGAQTYGGPVTLSADSITFSTGGALTLSGGLTGTGSGSGTVYLCGESATSYDITVGGAVSGVNDIYFNGNAAISSGATVTAGGAVSFAGTADLSAAVTSTGASVSFDAAATVNSTGSVSANTDIAFGGTANVNGAVTAVNDIVFTGEATVGAEVKSTDGNITFNDTATLGCKNVSASENITFESSAILSENLTFTATTVTFNGKLVSHSKDSRKNATIKGNAVFNGVVGAQEPAVNNGKISALTVSGTSTVSNNIYTTGAQTYGGPVTLSADRITFSTGGTLTLTGGLTGTGSGSGTVTLCDSAATYSNTITVGGAVSGVNDIYFNGNAAISSGATVTADGAVSFAGTADLSAAVTSGGAGVSFDAAATVNSTGSVSANTDIAFGGTATVNGTVTAVNDIDFTGEATVGAEVKASNDITFNGTANVNSAVTAINALVFNGDTTITSAVKGNTVTFNGSLILNNGSVTSTKDQNFNVTTQFGWWQTLTSTEGSIYFGKESSVTKINCIGSNSGLGLMVTTSSAGNVYFYGGFSGSVSLQICGNAEIYGDNTFTSYTEQSAGFETTVNFYGENKFTDFTPAASNYAQTFNFKGASTFTKFTATANAAQTFNFDGANTFETFTATAKSAQNFNFSGKNSFSSLTATATANQNFYFTDSNSFTLLNLTASGAPLTVQFAGGSTQTFGNSSSAGISLKGKSETNCVMLTSDSTDLWNAVFLSKPDSSDFTYTVIKYSASVDSDGEKNELNLIPASSTVQDYSPASPTTVSWFTHKFYWLGGSDTNWTTVSNWAYDESGTNSSAIYPSYTDGLSEVTVLKGNSTSSSPFILTLTEAITVKSIQIESGTEVDFAGKSVEAETILIEENSTADFAGAVVAASGGITNNGTLKLAGTESISGTKTNGTDSTVQYYGSAITALSWGSEYEKLEFIEGAAGSASEAMNVAKTLVIKNGSGNALELSGNGTFTGEVTLTDAGNITFGGANSFNDALNVVSADNISFSEGNAFAGKVNVTSAENLSFTQANTFEKTVTVTEAQDISFDAANTFNDVIKIVSAGDINFAGENSFAGALEIASAENVILNANTNGVELAGNVECETLDAKCAVTVGGSVTTSGTLTAGTETVGQYYESTVNFADKAVLTDNSTANKVYISGAATGEGDITINADAVFVSTLDTKGALKVGGTLQADGAVGSTTPPTDINVTGDATFASTLDASGDLNFSANATFNGEVGSNNAPETITLGTDTTNTATFESTLDLTDALTAAGTLTVNGALGSSNAPASITVGADAIFGENASVNAAGSIDIKNNATFGSTLDTTDALTVGGTLQSDGAVGATKAPTDINVTGDATFASTLDASGALTVGGNAAFCSDVGTGGVIVYGTTDTIAQIQSINVTGQTYFNSTQAQTVQTAGEQTYAQKITVDSVLSLIADDSSGETDEVITLNGISEGTNTASSVSVKSAIVNLYAADYSTYGSQTFSCSKGVRLLSSSDSGGTWQCKNSDAEITLDETELFLDFDSCSMKLQSPLKAKNVYFYSGALGLPGVTLSATDFVAFGASYSAVDGRFSSSNTRFAYYGADSIEYKKLSDFNASLSCSDEAQIEVEGNFYANGLDLASFTLTIPDNSDSNPEFNSTDAVTQKQWGLPYAVAFNSKISSLTVSGGILAAGSDDGVSGLSAQGCTDGSSNTGVQFELPQITKAYSVYDDVVYVEFNIPLENSKGEISTNLALYTNGELSKGGAWYSSSAFYFEGAYSDADCTTPVSSDTDIQSFYLKGIETWNTDATGKLSYGSAAKSNEDSTDRSGTHKNVTTDLSFLEGLFTAADGHTMCSTYNDTTAYTATEDHASPVLIAAYTGQELHTTGTSSSQSTHDAHNFIELRYSEAVDIAGLKNDGADENVRADSSLGGISGSGTQSTDSTGLTIAGLAEISDGILLSSSKDAASPHSLYRNFATLSGQEESAQTHRVRISIAGYVSGTVSFTDSKNPSCSGTYHDWIGCIKSATTPQGTVKVLANSAITDLASSSDGTALQNQIDSLGSENHALKEVTINSYSDGTQTDVSKEGSLYGEWDTMPPVITPFIRSGDEWQTWANSTEEKWEEFEIIGTSDSSSDSTLKYVEIHFLDNDKTQAAKWSDYWRTKSGWNEDGSLPETRGGARPFTSSSLTTGGIRLSSLKDANSSFTYTTGGSEENFDSSTDISQITYGGLFKSRSDPSTVTDGLYIRLPLEDLSLAIRTTFELFYNPEDSYITDLAGNLLSSSYSEKTGFVSIDITAPSVLLTLAPIGEKQIYAVFSKQLAAEIKAGDKTTSTYFKDLDASDLNEVLANIAETFIIVKEGSDSGTTAEEIAIQKCEYVSSSDDYTALLFTLEDSITLSNVETLWLRNTGNSEEVQDLSGLTVKNTIIRDSLGNYMTADSGHAISDFAVNALDVLYAYANAKDGDDWSEEGLYGQGIAPASSDYAVHDFSATQGNYGKLLEGRDITVQVQVTGGTDSSGISIVPENRTFVMIPSKKAQISSSSVSDKINALINADWRLWLPSALKAVASQANTNTLDSPSDPVTADDDKGFLWNYTLPQSTYGFAGGDEIQFLFKLVDSDGNDITIDNDADDFGGATQPTDRVPLYAVKMPEAKIRAGDFSFVDLWSFGIKSIKQQRGGVTILNNVINVNVREQTVVEVTTKEEGSLNVFVMTLDGNIVKRLNHGRVSAGTHYYRWNGTNNSGTPVARGLYFVRVVGPGIDETRKVMCVKEK